MEKSNEELANNELVHLMKKLETQFYGAAENTVKFIQGNNSAGTRARKAMQNIKNLSQEVRIEIQKQKNSVTV